MRLDPKELTVFDCKVRANFQSEKTGNAGHSIPRIPSVRDLGSTITSRSANVNPRETLNRLHLCQIAKEPYNAISKADRKRWAKVTTFWSFKFILWRYFQFVLCNLSTPMFASLTRWKTNQCYSLETDYLIFEAFLILFATISLIFTVVSLSDVRRMKHKVSHP